MWFALLFILTANPPEERGRLDAGSRQPPIDCGNAYYDCNQSNGEIFYPPGSASNPDEISAVRFDPLDFGFNGDITYINKICIADDINSLGVGVAPLSRIFVYPDVGGLPDENIVLGDFWVPESGNGTYEIDLGYEPIVVSGPFWIAKRGDPSIAAGLSLGMEICDFPPVPGHSYVSAIGVSGLFPRQFSEYVIHTELSDQRPVLPVPTLDTWFFWVFVMVIIAVATRFVRTK